MKSRNKILGICIVLLSTAGCGRVHTTDGQTTTILGWGKVTNGQTSSETGIGSGMNKNLGSPRASTFSDRSPAATAALGGE